MNAHVYKYYSLRPCLAVIIAQRLTLLVLFSWLSHKQTQRSLGIMMVTMTMIGEEIGPALSWSAHTATSGISYFLWSEKKQKTVVAQPRGLSCDWKHPYCLRLRVIFHHQPQVLSWNKTDPFPQLVTLKMAQVQQRNALHLPQPGGSRSAWRPQPHVLVGKLWCRGYASFSSSPPVMCCFMFVNFWPIPLTVVKHISSRLARKLNWRQYGDYTIVVSHSNCYFTMKEVTTLKKN